LDIRFLLASFLICNLFFCRVRPLYLAEAPSGAKAGEPHDFT